MKLVFRLAGVGFSLPLGSLVEIREGFDGAAPLPGEGTDSLPFRGVTIPFRDLRRRLELPADPAPGGTVRVLVLAGSDGPFGVLVDRVEGIFPEGDFTHLKLPLAFGPTDGRPYDRLELWRGEPLVVCDVARLETGWSGDD